jgi:hypothetical protein
MENNEGNKELLNIRDFDANERQEISRYIQANVPMTILYKLFPLTENPIEKGDVFCISYRLINTAKNMVENKTTSDKLKVILTENQAIYELLHPLYLVEKDSFLLKKYKIHKHIIKIMSMPETVRKINNMIDIFLVLAEKFELISTNNIIGLDIESDEGKEIQKDILNDLEGGPII